MQSPTLSAVLQPMERIRRVLWLAFIGVIAIYVCVAYLMFGARGSMGSVAPRNPLFAPFVIISLLTAAASRWIPASLLTDRKLRELLQRDPDPELLARNPQTGQVDPERLQKIKMLSAREQRLFVAARAFFTPFVVQLAFNEAIALYGLVLSNMSRSFLPILPFAAVALALQLTVSPKLDPLLDRAGNLRLSGP
jgi:hypothetical protein